MAEETNSQTDDSGAGQANPAQQTGGAESGAESGAQTDYLSLIDGVVDRRVPSIIKSLLKEQGVDGDEAKDIITAWRDSKKSQTDTHSQKVAELEGKIAELTSERQAAAIGSAVAKIAGELDVDPKRIDHLQKLADLSEVVKDGKVDEEAVKAALTKVLADVPEFKRSGGLKVGADGGGAGQGTDEVAELLKSVGIKPKE